MPTAVFSYKLKPGVTKEVYEEWIVKFDYPHVALITSIISQRIHRVNGVVFGQDEPGFDYVEVIEFSSLEEYINDLTHNVNAKAIADQIPLYVEVVSNAWGEFIPPGVAH
jgi:hypothetical protein